jgi:hypothetical protein
LSICGFEGPSAGGVAPHPLVIAPLPPVPVAPPVATLPPLPVAPPVAGAPPLAEVPPVLVAAPPVPVDAPPVPAAALPPLPDNPLLLTPQPPATPTLKPATTTGTSTRQTCMGPSFLAIRKPKSGRGLEGCQSGVPGSPPQWGA